MPDHPEGDGSAFLTELCMDPVISVFQIRTAVPAAPGRQLHPFGVSEDGEGFHKMLSPDRSMKLPHPDPVEQLLISCILFLGATSRTSLLIDSVSAACDAVVQLCPVRCGSHLLPAGLPSVYKYSVSHYNGSAKGEAMLAHHLEEYGTHVVET